MMAGTGYTTGATGFYSPAAIAQRRAVNEAGQAPHMSLAAHTPNPAYAPWLQQQKQGYAAAQATGNPNTIADFIGGRGSYNRTAALMSAGTLQPGAAWQADLQQHSGGSPTAVAGAQGPLTGYPSHVGTNVGPSGADIGTPPGVGTPAGGPSNTPASTPSTVGGAASGTYTAPNYTPQGTAPSPWTPTTAGNMALDPGYQFRLEQGRKALEGSAAARGGLLSGNTLQGINDYAQGAASQEFGAADQRRRADYSTQYGNFQDQRNFGRSTFESDRNFGQGQFTDARNFNYARDVGDRAFDYQTQTGDRDFNYGRIRDLLAAGLTGTQGQAGSNDRLAAIISAIQQNNGQISGNAAIGNGNIASSAISQAIQQALYQSLFGGGGMGGGGQP